MDAQRNVEKARGRLADARQELTRSGSAIAELERDKVAAAEDASAFAKIDGKLQSARADRERLMLVIRRRESELADVERELAEESRRAEVDAARSAYGRAEKREQQLAFAVESFLRDRTLVKLRDARDATADAEARLLELLPEGEELARRDEPDWPGFAEAAEILAQGSHQPRRARAESSARAAVDRKRADEQDIVRAVDQLLDLPQTSVEGRELIDELFNRLDEELRPEVRRRYQAELGKRRAQQTAAELDPAGFVRI